MHRFKLAIATAVLLGVFGLSVEASAGNIQSVKWSEAVLSGEIQPGDAERIVTAMLASAIEVSPNNYLNPMRLVVNSLGGNVKEALNIASLVKAAHLDVMVVTGVNGTCASSCFFHLFGRQRTRRVRY